MTSKLIAVIAGVGPGTGAAVARKFAASYPVVLLARSASNYESLAKEINEGGGKAIGISTDITDSKSIKSAVSKIHEEFGNDVAAAAAIFNASSRPAWKPFLELTEDEFTSGFQVSGTGAFHFSQAVIPLLLKSVESSPKNPPTLIFTGATAALRGGAKLSSFATAKFALRALSQSLAREFGPQGVHVSHAIIDGIIDTEGTKDMLKDTGADAKISVENIADSYWYLHTQPRNGFTQELDLRPFAEKW